MLRARLLMVGLALVLAACGKPSGVLDLKQAELLAPTPANSLNRRPVSLPHTPEDQWTQEARWWVYRLQVPAMQARASNLAVFIPDQPSGTRMTFNGKALELINLLPYEAAGVFALLPPLFSGEPAELELYLPSRPAMQSRLGAIQVGEAGALRKFAQTQSLFNYSLGSMVSFSFFVVGTVCAFAMGMVSSQPLLFLLSFVSLTISLRQGQLFFFGGAIEESSEVTMYLALRMIAFLGCALALPMAARKPYRDILMAACLAGLIGTAILLLEWFPISTRRLALLGLGGAVFLPALLRSWRTFVDSRQWLWLFCVGLMCAHYLNAFVIWIDNPYKLPPNTVFSSNMFSLFGMIFVVFYLALQFHQAYRKTVDQNVALDLENQRYKVELEQSMKRVQETAIKAAAMQDRENWMREIHDGVGSQLVAARILSEQRPSAANAQAMTHTLEDALDQLRMLIEALSPNRSSLTSLMGEMRFRLTARLQAIGLQVIWEVDQPLGEEEELSPESALNIQRIVQEALINAIKHSQASSLRVAVFSVAGQSVVQVDDNGRGLDLAGDERGRGLFNMRKRATQCQASIRWLDLSPGTRVELVLKGP